MSSHKCFLYDEAVLEGKIDKIDQLFKDDIPFSGTCLDLAIKKERVDIVRWFLSHNVEPTEKSFSLAMENNNKEICNMLLCYGCITNVIDIMNI